MDTIYETSNRDMAIALGSRFREYRIRCRMTQREMAEKSGVALRTIGSFENGSQPNIGFLNLIALLRAVGMLEQVEQLLPELLPDPKQLYLHKKTAQRVKHGRDA